MKEVVSGVLRFREEIFPKYKGLFDRLADHQSPDVLFITCADSRIDPNLITQSPPGKLFICRNAGNIVPPHSSATGAMTASIEYAVAVLKIEHIIICGHTDCGAMRGALDLASLENLPHVEQWLGNCRSAMEVVKARHDELCADHLQEITEENVRQQLQHLRTHPAVAAAMAVGKMNLYGWIYNIETGEVLQADADGENFCPIKDLP